MHLLLPLVNAHHFALDRTEFLGAVPKRHSHLPAGNARMFAMARGADGAPALDMTKWFDTNYHYEVPELESPVSLRPNFDSFLVSVLFFFRVFRFVLGFRVYVDVAVVVVW